MSIWNSVKLLTSPKAFARAEVQKAKLHQQENPNVSYGDLEEWYETSVERAQLKRKGLFTSFLLVVLISSLGFTIANLVNSLVVLDMSHIRYVRLASIIVIGWAVMGRISNETKTISGKTLLEKTNENTYKYFYLVGLFITTISLFLEPTTFNNQIQPTPDSAG